MSQELVVLRKFPDELSAQVAAAALEANGIPARVLADTAGGALPNLSILFPVRLVVRAEDEALAREILDSEADPPDAGEAGDIGDIGDAGEPP